MVVRCDRRIYEMLFHKMSERERERERETISVELKRHKIQ